MMRLSFKEVHGLTIQSLWVLLLCASSLAAQTPARADSVAHPARTVVGRVLDEASRPLSGVEVRVAAGASSVTDSSGRFVLTSLSDGALQLVARKVGFDSSSTSVPGAAGSSTEVSKVSIVLTRTHRLNEIVVEGQSFDRALWDLGFYHRRKVASGTFFDQDAIEHFGGDGVGSLVRQVPRVDVRRIDNADYAFSTIAGRACRMNIFIDGMFQRVAMPSQTGRSEGVGLNELIGFREIAAVEVYPRASSVPIQFMRMGPAAGPQGISSQQIPLPGGLKLPRTSQGENQDAACGAIVIWTKSPGNSKPDTTRP
jgi:hypothetical protein